MLLFNARRKLFQVAQFGMVPSWKTKYSWDVDRASIIANPLPK